MGRKGVSKRKPPQGKAKPLSKDIAIADVYSIRRAKESPLDKPPETDNTVARTSRGNSKHSSDPKKNHKKR